MRKIILTMVMVIMTMIVVSSDIVPHKVHIGTPQGEIEYTYIVVGGERVKLE